MILLLVWGGLNALGVAVIIGIPFLGGAMWFAYQLGKDSKVKLKNFCKPAPRVSFQLFRG